MLYLRKLGLIERAIVSLFRDQKEGEDRDGTGSDMWKWTAPYRA